MKAVSVEGGVDVKAVSSEGERLVASILKITSSPSFIKSNTWPIIKSPGRS